MEYVNFNGNTLETVFINHDCSFMVLNGVKKNTVKINTFDQDAGKFETEDNIIKYSKKMLYLYDKACNLLGVFTFSKNVNQDDSPKTINRFYLKRNCYITLYKKNDEYYIKCDNEPEEKVKEKYMLGTDTVYLTNKGCKLQINNDKKRNSKWNGIPISPSNIIK